jgi:multiple sugar transport system ATP-binding protein
MGAIRLEQVWKTYPNGVEAVRDVSLEVADGEFVVLVGPSGCGKSTLLRMIAGLEHVTGGTVHIGERDVTTVLPPDRDIAMVFQNYALYPHMTVRRNLGFGLKQRGTDRDVIAERVGEIASMLGLDELLERRPAQLSGGQRQRVAIGRALVRNPSAFLLDEPLSNLDAKLRTSMRSELARLHERLKVTTVYVTHDQIEAMTLGDRVVVLRDGVVQQIDTPQALYRTPANLFVAAFIGSPAMNLVGAEAHGDRIAFAGHELALAESAPLHGLQGSVVLGVRPSAFVVDGSEEWPAMRVRLGHVEHLGDEIHAAFTLDAPRVAAEAVQAAADTGDDQEGRLLADDERARFLAVFDGRVPAREGEEITLRLDPERMHAFDAGSGEALGHRPRAAASGRPLSPGGDVRVA